MWETNVIITAVDHELCLICATNLIVVCKDYDSIGVLQAVVGCVIAQAFFSRGASAISLKSRVSQRNLAEFNVI